ncbi:MAG: hypothetical protein IPN69_09855 [Acidobacteria bacterium]|nr:hypothetical protein [Acidobacteriota bacterium]
MDFLISFNSAEYYTQTADSLGRTLDNLERDIRTVASDVVGVGDSAEVYALRIIVNG